MTPDLDEVIMRESAERGAELYVFPKNDQGVHITPVMSAPLPHAARGDEPRPIHWVIAGFGHCTWAQCLLRATDELDSLQRTCEESI